MEELLAKGTGWVYSDLVKAASEVGGPLALLNQVRAETAIKVGGEMLAKGRKQGVLGSLAIVGGLSLAGLGAYKLLKKEKSTSNTEEIVDEIITENLKKYNEKYPGTAAETE